MMWYNQANKIPPFYLFGNTTEKGSLDVLTFDQRPKLALTTYLGFVTTLKAIDVNKRTAADN